MVAGYLGCARCWCGSARQRAPRACGRDRSVTWSPSCSNRFSSRTARERSEPLVRVGGPTQRRSICFSSDVDVGTDPTAQGHSRNSHERGTRGITPRPLTERETGWIRDILQANDEWRGADISRTQVVAEGPCDEGSSIRLQSPEPENPIAKPIESV